MAKATGTVKCGFCMTGVHKDCKAEIIYYDKVWHCSCVECHPDRKAGESEGSTSED